MEISGKLFSFPFEEEGWETKMLIGGLIMLGGMFVFPLYWVLMGYGLRVMKRVIETGEYSLPEWDDWGGFFIDGLKMTGVQVAYALPMIILIGCGIVMQFAFLPLAAIDPESEGLIFTALILSQLGSLVLIGISILFGIVATFMGYIALTRMVAHDRFGAAFEFGEVWSLTKKGFKYFIIALAVFIGVSFAAGIVFNILIFTVILLCVLPFITAAWSYYGQVLVGALFGQAYRAAQAEMGPVDAPLPDMV